MVEAGSGLEVRLKPGDAWGEAEGPAGPARVGLILDWHLSLRSAVASR